MVQLEHTLGGGVAYLGPQAGNASGGRSLLIPLRVRLLENEAAMCLHATETAFVVTLADGLVSIEAAGRID